MAPTIRLSGLHGNERSLMASALDPRVALASKLSLLIGLFYLVGPIDLIHEPHHPIIGHLDEAVVLLAGLAGAVLFLPHRDGRSAGLPLGKISTLARALVMGAVAFGLGRLLLRLSLGRWPGDDETRRFRESLGRFETVPPLLRALATIPEGRQQLTRAMLMSWMLAEPQQRERVADGLPRDGAEGSDRLHVWLGPKIAFLHLEKTAGTSLARFLTGLFHPMQLHPDPNRTVPPHLLTPVPPDEAESIARYPLVWGHYDLPAMERLGPDRVIVSVLRDPRARILSLYKFWRETDDGYLARSAGNETLHMAKANGLAAFLRIDAPILRNSIDNFYVRRLTGLYARTDGSDPVARDPDGALRAALEGLARIHFLGVMDRMDDFMVLLCHGLDIEAPDAAPRLNVTGRNVVGPWSLQTPAPIPPPDAAAEQALTELTRLDRVVWQAARDRFATDFAHLREN